MQKIYLLSLFLFFSTLFFSQQTFIKGKVLDSKSKEPLTGVAIKYGAVGTVSDFNGEFLIDGEKGKKVVLEFKYTAYDTVKVTTAFPKSDTISLTVSLKGMNELLDEVVISAGKFDQKLSDVTISMEVIKPALIESKNTTSLEIFMNQVPSVNTYDGQISIRNGSGFSYGAGSRVLILVDEMPMISADAGDIKWNYLPIENMEQIEVLKGAASALFGSSALNGVINLRTAYAKDVPHTSVTLYQGIYCKPDREEIRWWPENRNQQYKGLNFSHSEKIGQWDLVLGGHVFDDEGFRQGESETRERFNTNIRYRFKKIKGLTAGANFNMMDYRGGLFFLWKSADEALTPSLNSIQGYHNDRFNVDPFIVYSTEKYGKHSLRTRYFKTNNVNDKNQGSLAELYYGEYQFQKRFQKNFTFTSGIVYMTQNVYSDSIYGKHDGKNAAAYAQFDKKIQKLTLSLGLRGEHFRVDTAQTKGVIGNSKINNLPFQPVMRFGMNYQLFEYSFLRASFGQGYRFPSIAEKFVSTSVSSLKIIPNTSLQPERGYSAELGIKQGFKISRFRGFIDLAGFYTEYRNMIEFVFGYYGPSGSVPINSLNIISAQPYAGFKSLNIYKGRISGIDFSISGKGKIGPFDIALMGGYTYSKAINPNYIAANDTISPGTLPGSNLLKYRTPHMFKNDMQFDWKGFSIGWSTRYQSKMSNIDKRFDAPLFYDVAPTALIYILPGLHEYRLKEPNGFWFHDFRVSYQISKSTKAAIILNNATNTEYMPRPGTIGPPRTLVFQLNVKI